MESKLKKYRVLKLTLQDDSSRFVIQRKYHGFMQSWKPYDGTMYETEKETLDKITSLILQDEKSYLSKIKKEEILKH